MQSSGLWRPDMWVVYFELPGGRSFQLTVVEKGKLYR